MNDRSATRRLAAPVLRCARAFTLVELLVVLLVIGLLVGFGLAYFAQNRRAADDTRAKKNVTTAMAYVEALYGTQTPTVYGETTAELVGALNANADGGLHFTGFDRDDPPQVSGDTHEVYVSRDSAVQYTICVHSSSERIWCLRASASGTFTAAPATAPQALTVADGDTALSWGNSIGDALCWLPSAENDPGTCPESLGGGSPESGYQDWRGTPLSGDSSPPPPPPPPPPSGEDTTAPSVQITQSPSGVVSSTSASIGFSATDDVGVSGYECKLDSGSFTACSSPKSYTSLGDGSHTVTVRASDVAGNSATDSRTWTVDATNPVVTITSVPSGYVSSSTAAISFTVVEPRLASTQCKLDSGNFTACSSPKSYTGLGEGSHTVTVKATDTAGNTASASSSWTVDSTAPAVTILSAPSGYTDAQEAAISFTAADAGGSGVSLVSCRLNSGSWTHGCTSPYELSGLGDGAYTVTVKATDNAGNWSQETVNWTVDATDPSVSISGPSGVTSETSASITFSYSDDNPVTQVRCRLDSDGWINPCTSPRSLSGLGQGAHTFRVEATDAAQNTGYAEISWTVDSVAPSVQVTAAPSGTVKQTSAAISFSATDATSGVVLLRCKLDSGSFASCTSPKSYAGLGNGSHTVTVEATDAAGNTATDEASWSVDATAPTVEITDGPTADAATKQTTASISFTTDDNVAVTQVRCKLDTGEWTTPCTSPQELSSLLDGAHTFTIEASDAAGNTGTASRSWTVDGTPPVVTIINGISGTTGSTSVSISFTAADEGGQVSVRCKLDSGSWELGCTSPYAKNGLSHGAHTITVRAIDDVGNTTDETISWSVDSVGPAVTVSVPTFDELFGTATPTFSGAAGTAAGDLDTITVKVYAGASASGAPVQTLSATASGSSWSKQASPALADGQYTVRAEQSDAYGNTTQSNSRTFTTDATAPTVTLTAPAAAAQVTSNVPTISGTAGTASGDSATVTVKIYSGSSVSGSPTQTVTTTRSGASWSTTPSSELALGTFTVQASQADSAGNTGTSAAVTFSVIAAEVCSDVSAATTPFVYVRRTSGYVGEVYLNPGLSNDKGTQLGTATTAFRPVISPDGKKVAYRRGSYASGNVWITCIDNSASYDTGVNPTNISALSWAPDSRSFVFQSAAAATQYDLLRVEITNEVGNSFPTSSVKDFSGHVYAAYSHDGSYIYYQGAGGTVGGVTCGIDIFRMNPDGTGATQMKCNPGDDQYPVGTQDYVWFVNATNGASVLNVSTGAVTAIGTTSTTNMQGLKISPDGSKVLWESNSSYALKITDIDGDPVQTLTSNCTNTYYCWNPVWIGNDKVAYQRGASGNPRRIYMTSAGSVSGPYGDATSVCYAGGLPAGGEWLDNLPSC